MNREFSAGGVVYKKEGESVLWLIRRSMPSDLYPEENRWTLPKGWIDSGETAEKAAAREVEEEGWTEAKIIKKISDQRIVYTPRGQEKTFKIISYYLMEYQGESQVRSKEIEETAEIKWLTFTEARKLLIFSSERKELDLAKAALENNLQVDQEKLF